MSVTIVDYGAGNLRSVANAFYLAGADPVLASDPDEVADAERVVLPGVGAAGPALVALRETGMAEALDLARDKGAPIMGICLGMQMMAERLDEFGSHDGLGWIPGHAGPIEDNTSLPCRGPP
ncbi:MAG: imidazole glycerol phosphate synthase subunit HisH, partial [Rhodospirillaceae bacterium]|nr:imidazole glycerol phosphate synthase subunit HisH [Rhodospirillaceae bacterium]